MGGINKLGYFGVHLKPYNRYMSDTTINGKWVYIGYDVSAIDAAKRHDDFIIKNGLNKPLNFPIYPENLIPNTRQIQLTQGKFAIVDEFNFEWLNQWKWKAIHAYNTWYATRELRIDGAKKMQCMHRLIMNTPTKLYVDHIDGDGLYNAVNNLRICTNSQNGMNRGANKNSVSIYKGVSWSGRHGKWVAQIFKDGKTRYSKEFYLEIDAALQYNIWTIELFGEFAKLNIIL